MTTIFHPLASAARARPEHPILVMDDAAWTAAELCQYVARVAAGLANQGLTRGTPVALLGPVCSNWVVALHALGWIGAIAVPTGPGPDAQIDPSVAFAISCGASVPTHLHKLDLHPAATPLPEPRWPLGEVRLWMQTSGSSGVAKTVPVTCGQLLFSAMGSAIRLGHLPNDRWFCCLPLHHIGGLSILFRTAFYGTCSEVRARFDATQVNRRVDSGDITQISLVPTMLARLLDARHNRPFPEQLRFILLGGASCPAQLRRRCTALGIPVAYTWGMTETASQVATSFPDDPPDDPRHVGPPLTFARVCLRSQHVGPLVVDGPITEGSVQTSDVGDIDARGHVHIHHRSDRIIISGGENVDPSRVEQTLCAHPQVEVAAVIGMPDPHWGERVAAVLVAARRQNGVRVPPEQDAFATWCRQHLAPYERPQQLVWCQQLPQTTTDKLPRAALLRLLTPSEPHHAPTKGR